VRQSQARIANAPEISGEWLDISVPIYTGMVYYPDDPSTEIQTLTDVRRGDLCTISRLTMGSHTGTHIDAPSHFLPGGTGVDEVPLEHLVGPARVIEIEDPKAVKAEELMAHKLDVRERLLFKTSNSERCWNTPKFVPGAIAIAEDAAVYLASLNTLAVGIDYLSAGSPETHRALLGSGVVIIEGLNLSGISPGRYELLCLPLRISGIDGAPARALLRASDGSDETKTSAGRKKPSKRHGGV